jgi:hypothetical protein
LLGAFLDIRLDRLARLFERLARLFELLVRLERLAIRLLFLGAFLEGRLALRLARLFRTRLGFLEGFLETPFTLGFLTRSLDFGGFSKIFLDIYYMYIIN